MKRKLLIITLLLGIASSPVNALTPKRFEEEYKKTDEQNWAHLKSSLWAQLGTASTVLIPAFILQSLQLAKHSHNLKSPVLGVGSVACAGVPLGLAMLTAYSIKRSREQYAASLHYDLLKKKQEYAQGIAKEPSEGRKQWEHFKSTFWNTIAMSYAGHAVGTGKALASSALKGQWNEMTKPLVMFLVISAIYAPASWFTSKWAREDTVKAVADDFIKTEVPPSSEGRKNWLYLKSGYERGVSAAAWFTSFPFMLPAILAWHTSQWSRQALIKSLKEDIEALEEKETAQ